MGHQLYCVVYKQEVIEGKRKRKIRGFRAPHAEDNVEDLVKARLAQGPPESCKLKILPDEDIDSLSNYDRGHRM